MSRILAVAYYTFLEMIRDKVLYLLLFFAIFIIAIGIGITQMTIGSELDIISDIGLGTIEIFSTVLSIFMGISLVRKELKEKTLHPLLAHPISRAEYIIGKFCGMSLMIIVEIALMAVIFAILLFIYGGAGRFITFIPAFYTIFLQTTTVIAAAVLCSTLTEQAVAAMLTISFYIIGATSYNLVYAITKRSSEFTIKVVNALRYILPDFSHFNIKDNLVYSVGIDQLSIGFATFYALLWVAIILSVAVALFNVKEIH
ncbi:ABC transporter permease subunit [bacterium]|nr:ABC transporter permease subunit [bacterium]